MGEFAAVNCQNAVPHPSLIPPVSFFSVYGRINVEIRSKDLDALHLDDVDELDAISNKLRRTCAADSVTTSYFRGKLSAHRGPTPQGLSPGMLGQSLPL